MRLLSILKFFKELLQGWLIAEHVKEFISQENLGKKYENQAKEKLYSVLPHQQQL